jgi:large subunit ribosomal protein L22e
LELIPTQFIINASQPASDKIFDVSAFEKFLQDKIKVDGRVGNLGDIVQISQVGEGKIEVVAHTEFSGRYLKYLYVFLSQFWINGGHGITRRQLD